MVFFGSLTFRYNSGQFNFGAAVGVGFVASYNPSDTGLQTPGYSTSVQGQAEVNLAPRLGAGVSASAQTSIPNARIANQGTVSIQTYINFPTYSTDVQANVSPHGQVAIAPYVQPGVGGSASLMFGVTYTAQPAVPVRPAPQPLSAGGGK